MRLQDVYYRAHDPRWAFSPLSGDGAAIRGGRFNGIGVPALYLALTPDGAVIEASQGFPHKYIAPLTLCSYEVDVNDIVDLQTVDDRDLAGVSLDDLGCAWELDRSNHIEPASWRVAKQLIANGAAGILVPSFARGARADMHNLVLWKWGPDLPHLVKVFDPSRRLPKNQLSWA